MTQLPDEIRRFSVHARHTDSHHAKVVEERSFEAAAVAYVEDLPATVDEDNDISVIVRDLGSGHQHCFRINLETGEAASCE